MKICYTDGATSGNGKVDAIGGFAWVITEDDKMIHAGAHQLKNTTNNICELSAIIDCCIVVNSMLDVDEEVTIYSDSAYIINCFNDKWWEKWMVNGWKNSKKQPVANRELWEELIPFFKDDRFIFKKVKGHSGNKWNEYVDTMAVKAKMGEEV